MKVHKFHTISSVKIVFLPQLYTLLFVSRMPRERSARSLRGRKEFSLKWKIWSAFRGSEQTCHKFADKCFHKYVLHSYMWYNIRCLWSIQKMRLKYQVQRKKHNTACLHIFNEIFIAHNLLSPLPSTTDCIYNWGVTAGSWNCYFRYHLQIMTHFHIVFIFKVNFWIIQILEGESNQIIATS